MRDFQQGGLLCFRQAPTLSGSKPRPLNGRTPQVGHVQILVEAGPSLESVRQSESMGRCANCWLRQTALRAASVSGRFSGFSFLLFNTWGLFRQSPRPDQRWRRWQRLGRLLASLAAEWKRCSVLPQGSLGPGRRLAGRGNGPASWIPPGACCVELLLRIRPWSPRKQLVVHNC